MTTTSDAVVERPWAIEPEKPMYFPGMDERWTPKGVRAVGGQKALDSAAFVEIRAVWLAKAETLKESVMARVVVFVVNGGLVCQRVEDAIALTAEALKAKTFELSGGPLAKFETAVRRLDEAGVPSRQKAFNLELVRVLQMLFERTEHPLLVARAPVQDTGPSLADIEYSSRARGGRPLLAEGGERSPHARPQGLAPAGVKPVRLNPLAPFWSRAVRDGDTPWNLVSEKNETQAFLAFRKDVAVRAKHEGPCGVDGQRCEEFFIDWSKTGKIWYAQLEVHLIREDGLDRLRAITARDRADKWSAEVLDVLVQLASRVSSLEADVFALEGQCSLHFGGTDVSLADRVAALESRTSDDGR